MPGRKLNSELEKIARVIEKMADPDVFVWLERRDNPSEQEFYRAATIVADRLCGAVMPIQLSEMRRKNVSGAR